MAEPGTLETYALKRKAKLAELKAKREKIQQKSDANPLPRPVFRNYEPADSEMKDNVVGETPVAEVEDFVQEELGKEKETVTVADLDFTSLAPRKPDWDLKRDAAPKLAKLEKRTQRAIAELIRDRLQNEDLANAVSVAARQQPDSDDDD